MMTACEVGTLGGDVFRLSGTPLNLYRHASMDTRSHTIFADSAKPSYGMRILRFWETDLAAQDFYPGLKPSIEREKHPTIWVLDCALSHVRGMECFSTTVSMQALLSALYPQRMKSAQIDLPQGNQSPLLDDLRAQYLAKTTLALCDDDRTAVAKQTQNHEPESRATARKLAGFLGITLGELGDITNIGRTTFSSWQFKNPRPATLRDLYRVEGLIEALRARLGDQETRLWLNAGEYSPLKLLRERKLSEVETRVSSLIFAPRERSLSFAIAPMDDEEEEAPAPIFPPVPKALPTASRMVRSRLTVEN